MARKKYRLLLIELTADQSEHAKMLNGPRKRITHAVMVPGVGQRFGTLKQCKRYYQAWEQLYSSLLLRRGEQLRGSEIEIKNFGTDPDLSVKLGELYDSRERELPAAERDKLRRQLHGPDASSRRERPAAGCAVVLALAVTALVLMVVGHRWGLAVLELDRYR